MNKVFLISLIILILIPIIYFFVINHNNFTEQFYNIEKPSNQQCGNINDFKMKKNMKQIDLFQDKLDSFNIDLDKTKLKVDKNYKQFKKSMKGSKTATNQLNKF